MTTTYRPTDLGENDRPTQRMPAYLLTTEDRLTEVLGEPERDGMDKVTTYWKVEDDAGGSAWVWDYKGSGTYGQYSVRTTDDATLDRLIEALGAEVQSRGTW